jgi:hypothetical protein
MRENTNWNNKIEYVEKMYEEWKNIYEIPIEKEFAVRALLDLQWEYQNIPENHYKAKADILSAINLLSNSLNLEKVEIKKYGVNCKIDLKEKIIILENNINTIFDLLIYNKEVSINNYIIKNPIIENISHFMYSSTGEIRLNVKWKYNYDNIDGFIVYINECNSDIELSKKYITYERYYILSSDKRDYYLPYLSLNNIYIVGIQAYKNVEIFNKKTIRSDIVVSDPYYPSVKNDIPAEVIKGNITLI